MRRSQVVAPLFRRNNETMRSICERQWTVTTMVSQASYLRLNSKANTVPLVNLWYCRGVCTKDKRIRLLAIPMHRTGVEATDTHFNTPRFINAV